MKDQFVDYDEHPRVRDTIIERFVNLNSRQKEALARLRESLYSIQNKIGVTSEIRQDCENPSVELPGTSVENLLVFLIGHIEELEELVGISEHIDKEL